MLPLRKAIAAELTAVHKVDIAPENVLVSTGAKHSLYNLFMALLDPGDEVLIPAPYWVSYPDMVMLAGGRPHPRDKARTIRGHRAAAAPCSARTRAIVSHPSNPTGAVYTARRSKRSRRSSRRRICSSSPTTLSPARLRRRRSSRSRPRTPSREAHILVDGFSEDLRDAGWRSATRRSRSARAADQGDGEDPGAVDIEPDAQPQIATLAAVTGRRTARHHAQGLDERRLEMVKLLRAIPGVTCREPKGAFYAFPDVSAYVGRKSPEGAILDDAVQLCDWLVEVGKVAVVPGSGFGAPGFVRLSYACSMQNIQDGVGRLAQALATLRDPASASLAVCWSSASSASRSTERPHPRRDVHELLRRLRARTSTRS